MRHLRLWILGAALGSFGAGMNVGLLIPKLAAGDEALLPDHLRHDLNYVERMVGSYGLSAEQARTLRQVLQAMRDEELKVLREADTAQLPRALQSKLLAARDRAEQRLRAVLTPQQRHRYDQDSRPQPEPQRQDK